MQESITARSHHKRQINAKFGPNRTKNHGVGPLVVLLVDLHHDGVVVDHAPAVVLGHPDKCRRRADGPTRTPILRMLP